MPKLIQTWKCSVCDAEHSTEEDAIKCERSHLRIRDARRVNEDHSNRREVPRRMFVYWNVCWDGETKEIVRATYTLASYEPVKSVTGEED